MTMPPAYHESLPYIDPEPSPSALAAARALITAEQQSTATPTPKPTTTTQSPSFTPAIQEELTRITSKTPLQPLDLSRYEAQETPPPTTPADRLHSVLTSAAVSDAYLSSRRQNLELLDRHGKNAWLIGNHHLEAELRGLETQLAEVKREVDLVNIQRQRRQAEVGPEMQMLEETWKKGVGRVLETEVAVEELKREIRDELRSRGAQGPQEAPE
ncbi:Pre-mRNA-splicing factor-like protein [Hapsidospora chrysogenum ATCC 11550]|uniref:Pre-mRNA-splicing factor-like protein n=1 Tax=Hapsidospora chrysogenum (strain ATCC 11550 / CBS 779.69 / DSM 880 / IAM 14645 / JCM 23072 / IMI 49137) TaxID=857340 RepID=A0A086T954_HAPC1|nr:Pre-mRNA-splicing factor-like protein [Hapsidospora chrysogenum ATCC 11550]